MYKIGDWKAVCDLCGLEFMASQLSLDPWGRRVDKKCFETRHPQEFVRARVEQITPPWTRPEEKFPGADFTANDTVVWSTYPDFIVYVDGTSAGFTLDLGAASQAALDLATRVQVVRLDDTTANTVTVTASGLSNQTLGGRGQTLIYSPVGDVWSFFGKIG